MGRINVLDKHVAELIAAGEVVERPASVIKELIENSIDSGAKSVTVEIKDGGISLMRVSDNGCGIMRDDIKNAFLRHATSKVKISDDLDAIGTLGFRGEALASIAAVSRVELLTKAAEDEIGTHYIIEGCDEVLMEDAGCPTGTTFIVRDIFYNVPARMKFLKKNVTEANAVSAVVEKEALSHSEVSFTLIRDNKKTLVTPGDGNLRNCVYSVFGREFTMNTIPVNYELDGVRVTGLVLKPQAARGSRAMQNFFINGRYVRSRTAMAALEEACKGMVMVGKFPGCVLHIDISLRAVDVNVHPSKTEVRFVNEKPVFDAVYHGVRTALIGGDTVKEFKMEQENPFENLIDKSVVQKPFTMSQHAVEKIQKNQAAKQKPSVNSMDNYRTLLEQLPKMPPAADKSINSVSKVLEHYNVNQEKNEISILEESGNIDAEEAPLQIMQYSEDEFALDNKEADMPKQLNKEETNIAVSEPAQEKSENIKPIISKKNNDYRFIGEAFATYILVEKNNEIVMVDKHALHERIIYEKLKKEQGRAFAQYLLEPVAVNLSKEAYSAILENKQIMLDSGFEIDDFGGSSIIVRSAPSFIDAFDIASTVEEMAEHIIENKKNIDSEYADWLYHNIACRSAVKGGDKSSAQELIKLYNMLEEDPNYRYCPHGRPTSITISKYQIEKQFGRIQ